jgi:acetyltransferase-like isoleucine patch superfamily enzyme
MRITLERSPEVLRGTFWRPISPEAQQRVAVDWLRRPTPEGESDKVFQRYETGPLDELDVLTRGRYVETRIEDPYMRGQYREGFYFLRSMGVFAHEDEIDRVEGLTGQIEAGAVISKGVRIEDGAYIDSRVELERGVRVMSGASIGRGSVVRKGSIVGPGVGLAAFVYVGQFSRLDPRANIDAMTILDRGVGVGRDASIGRQGVIGKQSQIQSGAWIDDSVTLRRHVNVAHDASVGEMTVIDDYSHIGAGSMVGAESRLGKFVRVGKGVFLVSPTIAPDGTALLTSNLFTNRAES